MQLNIKPVHFDGLNCFNDVIISIAAHYHRAYELAFAETWGFDFDSEGPDLPELLGDRIKPSYDSITEVLHQHCGINTTTIHTKDAGEVMSAIKQQLDKGMPTGIYIDTFWCPWHSGKYQRISDAHFCLAIGLDEHDNIYCIDPALNLEVSLLPYNDFKNGSGQYSIFELVETDDSPDYRAILEHSVTKLIETDFTSRIRVFASEFEANFDFPKEYSYFEADVWYVSIDRNIRFTAGGRTLYAVFLDYLSTRLKSQELLMKKGELQKAASKWNSIRGMLTKSYYVGFNEKIKTKVFNAILEVASFEEELLKQLLQTAQNIQGEKSYVDIDESQNLPCGHNDEIIVLDLVKHFNNKGFASSASDKYRADLSGTGHFFISKGFPGQELLQIENMAFKLPDVVTGRYDNISCLGQEISFEKGTYSSILFLGCSENGDFIDDVILRYENGEAEKIPVMFTDCWRLPMFKEIVAWVGGGGKWVDNVYTPHMNPLRIFAEKQPIQKSGPIEGIILPYCPNMHIFAISLQKAD